MHFVFCRDNESEIPGPYIPQQHHSYALPPTPQSLEQLSVVARLIAPRWVRQFLFTTDPVQTTILTSPFALDNAVTTKRTESNFIRSRKPTEPYAIQAQSQSVDAPFIAIDGFITGVGVREFVLTPLFTNSNPSFAPPSAFQGARVDMGKDCWSKAGGSINEHSRFVRILGGQIGLFVRICSHALHYIFLETFEFQSRTQRTRTNFIFHANDLRRIAMPPNITNESFQSNTANINGEIEIDEDVPPKADDLQAALALVQIIVEHCACQNCPFQTHCSCGPREATPASHAFDVRPFRESAVRQDGIFRGIEVFNQCITGAQILGAKLGVEHRGHTGRDKRIISRCVDWAVHDIRTNEPFHTAPPFQAHKSDTLKNGKLKSAEGCKGGTCTIYGYFGDLQSLDEHAKDEMPKVHSVEEKCPPKISRGVISSSENVKLEWKTGKLTQRREYQDRNRKKNVERRSGRTVQGKSKGQERGRRQSVRKSIGAQKIKYEELKKSIDSLQQSEVMLIGRERALRMENSRLRKLYTTRTLH